MGLIIDEFEPSYEALCHHPAFIDTGIPFTGRHNVVALLPSPLRRGGGGEVGRSIILNGHTDLVSVEPLSAWTHDPFGAEITLPSPPRRGVGGEVTGEVMFGRGTQDMKSGLIANLFAVKALQACGIQLKGDVILESVIEEEGGGGGGTFGLL
ncbi:MAG: M20/M25/M40 family metallo-hydrolase [Anaerolineae bacterium]|nr:M20/M25/M40 family metallo-hydrolase [Anaerolineae bacterium]